MCASEYGGRKNGGQALREARQRLSISSVRSSLGVAPGYVVETRQELKQVDYLESFSREGLSVIKVFVKPSYTSKDIPQVWDELRS
ncbi:MAG: hypothetical protein WBG18_20920 [Xanthobacteraceae bacterium]